MTNPIRIDIWSDIACPWCYIGKRNLERGLALRSPDEPPVAITYHSFELAPDTPVDFDGTEAEFLAGYKGLAPEQVQGMLNHVTRVAADAGLDYRFNRVRHTKTLKAHELLHFAAERGLQREMTERLFRAYFTEGGHVGRVDDLVALAGEVGLDENEARTALESGWYADAVRTDIETAGRYGIQGVPFFVLDGKYGLSGAQPPEAFAQALKQVAAERSTAAADVSEAS